MWGYCLLVVLVDRGSDFPGHQTREAARLSEGLTQGTPDSLRDWSHFPFRWKYIVFSNLFLEHQIWSWSNRGAPIGCARKWGPIGLSGVPVQPECAIPKRWGRLRPDAQPRPCSVWLAVTVQQLPLLCPTNTAFTLLKVCPAAYKVRPPLPPDDGLLQVRGPGPCLHPAYAQGHPTQAQQCWSQEEQAVWSPFLRNCMKSFPQGPTTSAPSPMLFSSRPARSPGGCVTLLLLWEEQMLPMVTLAVQTKMLEMSEMFVFLLC